MRRAIAGAFAAAVLVAGTARADAIPGSALTPYVVTEDAITEPLAGQRGDPALGQVLMGERHRSLCILCHALPSGAAQLQGTLAPSLAGIGARLSEGQIRLRIVDMKRLNPSSIMPSYYSLHRGTRTAPAWQNKPVLEAAEIERLVAYLVTLKE